MLSRLERFYIKVFGVPILGLRIRARRILSLAKGNFQRILDAGCGRGIFTFALARKFKEAQIVGIDLDKEQINTNKQIAQETNLTNCDFQVEDIFRLPFKEEFDLILCVDILEHLVDDIEACRYLFRVLKPGGKIIVHAPALYRRLLFIKRLNFDVPGHVRLGYLMDELAAKLENASFQIEHRAYTYGFLETLTNDISYLITRAKERNKKLYSMLFPLLLFISYWGKFSELKDGSGIVIVACREN